ncbi:MAG: glutaredoxin [Bdellovibrionota bacterium]
MKLIRQILGKIILLLDRLFSPKPIERSPEEQIKVDRLTSNLVVYQFEACPFCVKVRRAIKKLGLKIELRDVLNEPKYEEELMQGGKEYQVPCLRVTHDDGRVQWMYESSDIIDYLNKRFA